MKKRLALVLVLIMMASAATTALASPFADVPADHWAYDSVAELAAAGLIEGYPDGTYGGARMMTRYEAAMVFARALHRLEGQIAANNLLPELDKIKAELMAEIEAKMAAADKPVVETIETKVIEQRIDEQALARIRANEIAIDAMEGDMAYLEARMLGLIDGIRYDMNLLEEQHATGVEAPSMDEIEALIAARIQESLLDVASGVKETTIVERVVSTTPELTRQDVELIAEALIRQQVSEVERTVQENRDLIIGLVEWVDELDSDVRVLKDDVAGLKTSVAKLEKAPVISGNLSLKGSKARTKQEHAFSQTGTLNLDIKASEATNVKAIFGYKIEPTRSYDDATKYEFDPTNYRVEVASETPVSRVVMGRLPAASFSSHDFSKYVLDVPAADPNGAHAGGYAFGGLVRANLLEDLTLDLFAGRDDKIDQPDTDIDSVQTVRAAVALNYKFMPEIGVRLTGALDKPVSAMFTNYAAGIGLFGEVVGIEYTADFALDLKSINLEKNYLAVVTAKTEFEPVTLDAKFIFQEENYEVTNQLVDAGRKFGVEGGVGAEFEFAGLAFDLGGRAYFEGGATEASGLGTVLAFKADASATYEDFFVPVTLSASYAGNKTAEKDYVQHASAKLAVEEDQDYGLRYGASAQYVRNFITSSAWKDDSKYNPGDDRATFKGNLGYGVDWDGAKLDVDYDATFQLPLRSSKETKHLQHGLTLGYGFTENVTLTLGGNVRHIFSNDPVTHQFGYDAGLTVKF